MPPLVFPIAASIGYALASLTLKRGLYYGIGPWRLTFVVNLIAGLLFLPMLLRGGHWAGWEKIHEPILAGVAFFIGQIFTFRAIAKGDVSIVTPVLGLKSMLIAVVLAVFFQEPTPWTWWIASALCVVAVSLLADRSSASAKNTQATALLAFTSAVAFSVTDVLVQRWTPHWGPGFFIPIMFGTLAFLSLGLIPLFSQPLSQIPSNGWKWLIGGSVLLSGQALLMAYAIGVFGHATALNIVYSGRGIWTIVLVWVIGHWFSSTEQHLGRGVLVRRLIGAALLVVAIALL